LPYSISRQEVIEEQIGELLKGIRLSHQETENVYQAMKESLNDKMEYHNDAIKALEQKIAILQKRIDAAYIDKIDGRISEAFWKDHSDKWLREKEDAASRLLAHEKSDTHYIKSAKIILELTNKAYDLFMKQDSTEKRKLVNILLSNSSFDGTTLEFNLRKPFDTMVECKKSANWGG